MKDQMYKDLFILSMCNCVQHLKHFHGLIYTERPVRSKCRVSVTDANAWCKSPTSDTEVPLSNTKGLPVTFNEKFSGFKLQVVLQVCDIPKNTVNLVINTSDEGVETLEGMAQQLVVATGSDGTPIALRSVDVTSGSGNVYHALLQQDAANSDTQTVLLTQPE